MSYFTARDHDLGCRCPDCSMTPLCFECDMEASILWKGKAYCDQHKPKIEPPEPKVDDAEGK